MWAGHNEFECVGILETVGQEILRGVNLDLLLQRELDADLRLAISRRQAASFRFRRGLSLKLPIDETADRRRAIGFGSDKQARSIRGSRARPTFAQNSICPEMDRRTT